MLIDLCSETLLSLLAFEMLLDKYFSFVDIEGSVWNFS